MTTDMWAIEADQHNPTGGVRRDLDAERIVAASVMADPDLVDELAHAFDPADFSDDRYRWVWYAVEEIRTSLTKGEIRWNAVDKQLQAWRVDGRIPTVPLTVDQLAELYAHAQPGAAAYYADQITKSAVAARLAAFGHDATTRAKSPAFDADADVATLQAALDDLVRPERTTRTSLIGDLLGSALERSTTPPARGERIPTGFVDLDLLTTGGFKPGQLIVVGARPAMGKTTFATGIARAAAVHNKMTTLLRSLEMSEDELADCILCAEARVGLHHQKAGQVDDAGLARAAVVAPSLAAAPLHISDDSGLTLAGLRAQVRHLVRTEDLKLVIVDYLQLMEAPKAESRQVAVSMLSRGLKLMAREFGIAVVILAQLNRGPEQRQDKRPMVSDLRESGSIEQDADMVILLHREDAYDHESARAGEADLIVGKHRGGSPGTITVAFQGHYARFVDMAQT